MDGLNLKDMQKKIVEHRVQTVDQALSDYIQGVIKLLQLQSKDITKYALVVVDNPMELKESTVKISQQWRVIKISDLQNLPEYGD